MSILAAGVATRLGLRGAFSQLRWVPLLPLIVLEPDLPNDGRAERMGMFLLCCAAPQMAGYLLELERTGRLDQIRLAARTPFRIALQVIAAAGSPWIIGGLALLAWSIASDGRLNAPVVAAALIGASTALAAVSTTTMFRQQPIDPRIVIVGLGFIGASLGIAGRLQFWPTSGRVTTVAMYAVIVEAAITALCLRGILRRIAYPPVARTKLGAGLQFRPGRRRMRAPAFYRGFALASSGLALVVVFAPLILVARAVAGEQGLPSMAPFFLVPLGIGVLVISLVCREDAVLGRLDVVRQSALAPWRAAIETLAGLWAPFALSAIGLGLVAGSFYAVTPFDLGLTMLVLLAIAPLPVVEGWSRLWPMTFIVPYVVAMALPLRLGALTQGAALFALLWWSAIRRFNDSDRPVLSGWAATAATAILGAAPWFMVWSSYPPEGAMLASGTALMAASPLLEANAFGRHRDFWIRLSSIIMAATTVATASGSGWPGGVAAALATALIWIASLRVRQSQVLSPSRQGAVRVGGVIIVAVLVAPGESILGGSPFQSFAVAALGLLIAVEAALRATAFVKRRATPRA